MRTSIRKIVDKFKKRHEVPDSTPMAIPVGFKRPESIQSMVARLVRLNETIRQNGDEIETFEEADDFDTGEDFEPSSPYEQDFDLAAVKAIDHGVMRPPVRPEGFVDPRSKKKDAFEPEEPAAPRQKKKSAPPPEADEDEQ